MEKSKNIIKLKGLIQKVELDQPSYDFTSVVMEEITAKESVVNPELKSLLMKGGVSVPKHEFTRAVMAHVRQQSAGAVYKPIIGKKVWVLASVVFVIFVMMTLRSSSSYSPSDNDLTSSAIYTGSVLNKIFSYVTLIPPLYSVTFLSLAALLMIDYLVRALGRPPRVPTVPRT